MNVWMHRAACLAFVVLALGWHVVARLPAGHRGLGTVILYSAMSAVMLLVWSLTRRVSRPAAGWILTCAVASRLATFNVSPFLSHDVDRYLWDGRVALEGYDPYRIEAGDPELATLRVEFPTPEEHLAYPTLYPPLSIGVFAVCSAAGPELGPWVWRMILLASSMVLLFATHRVLTRIDALEHLPLIALSPLLIVETHIGLHLDGLVAAAVAVGTWAIYDRRSIAGAGVWALGAALKILPVALIGAWLVRRKLESRWRAAALAALVIALPYAAVVLGGWTPIGSLSAFFGTWRFGSPFWRLFEPVVGEAMPHVAIAGAGLSALAVLVFSRRSRDAAILPAAMACALVWSPVVFPWYVLPLVPLLAVVRSYALLAWFVLLPLTYEILDRFDVDASWEPEAWPVVMVALGWVVGLALDFAGRRSLPSNASMPGTVHPTASGGT